MRTKINATVASRPETGLIISLGKAREQTKASFMGTQSEGNTYRYNLG